MKMDLLRSTFLLFVVIAVATGDTEVEDPFDTPMPDVSPLMTPVKPELPEVLSSADNTDDIRPVGEEIKTEEILKIPDLPDVLQYSSPEENIEHRHDNSELQQPVENPENQLLQHPVEAIEFDSSSPMDNSDEMNGANPEMFATSNDQSAEVGARDLLAALEIGECANVTCRTSFKEKVKSWMCEYTKYTVELLTWIESFEEWWYGCEESSVEGGDTSSDSIQCPDIAQVNCINGGKKVCADDRMGCTRCICKDGQYSDSSILFKIWKKEMEAFKTRFEAYKTKVSSCTRLIQTDECDVESPPEESGSGSGDEFTIPDEEGGSGEEGESGEEGGSGEESGDSPDDRMISGSGSGEEDEEGSGNLDEAVSGSGEGSGDQRSINGSGSGDGSGEFQESGSGSGDEPGDGSGTEEVTEGPPSPEDQNENVAEEVIVPQIPPSSLP